MENERAESVVSPPATRADGAGRGNGHRVAHASFDASMIYDTGRSLESLGARWQEALDAAQAALSSAGRLLPEHELHERSGRLTGERAQVTQLLEALAHDEHVHARFTRLLVPSRHGRRLLGLSSDVVACVFNLDGVLIGSAAAHAAAWAETFAAFLSARVERTGGRFAPFSPLADYPRHMHGRPRLEGVRAFLASRGIRLPEGDPSDPPGAETVQGLANRKRDVLLRLLHEHAPAAYEGSREYLEIARDAGVHRAVVSASANTRTILEGAGLTDLIEESIDGNTMVAERMHVRPAPDTLLAACRRLGVEPEHSAAFETTPAGIAAARAADFELVVGVEGTVPATALREAGADLVIPSLAELLERNAAR